MSQKTKTKRFYRQGHVMPVEEDAIHEFKGHRNLQIEDVPPWARDKKKECVTRRAVSRALNAFLNTGKGGTVYLGVSDDGKIHGLKLTNYQKDHMVADVADLFSRYRPTVPNHRYKVKFVPVVAASLSEEEALKVISRTESEYSDTTEKERKHVFRTYTYCWCDNDAIARINMGILSADYVVEIIIKPWNPADPRNTDTVGSIVQLYPVHEDEEGNVYIRRQASVVRYTANEIAQLSRQQTKEACEQEIQRLREEVHKLKEGLAVQGETHIQAGGTSFTRKTLL